MAESPQFETLVQSLSSTLQSLEQKRKELKKQGHSTGIWVGGIILVIGIASVSYTHLMQKKKRQAWLIWYRTSETPDIHLWE